MPGLAEGFWRALPKLACLDCRGRFWPRRQVALVWPVAVPARLHIVLVQWGLLNSLRERRELCLSPEIKLGVIAGIGGTQRMTKLIGRAKSMDMHLTGRMMGAEEALNCGLIARIFPDEELVENALGIAEIISQYSKPALTMITNSIHKSDNLTLEQGLKYERSLFYSLFDTNDQKEGMKAFIEKRKPTFNGT